MLRNQKPPENRQKSGLFWASPFTMHLVCTLSKQLSQRSLQDMFPRNVQLCFSRASAPPPPTKSPPKFTPKIVGIPLQYLGERLRGRTYGDKPSPNADSRRFSLIFADSRLFPENEAFGKRRFSQKTADSRRKPQKPAGTRRKPQIGVCPLRFVPLSAALISELWTKKAFCGGDQGFPSKGIFGGFFRRLANCDVQTVNWEAGQEGAVETALLPKRALTLNLRP